MRRVLAGFVTSLFIVGCSGAETEDSGDPTGTTGTTDGVPVGEAELLPWLEGGGYLGWEAESAVHSGAGPHFGDVRTYVGPALFASLEAGTAQHPAGAAAVKELYGGGTQVQGWAVAVKTDADSAAGDGWYWYEYYQGSAVIEGQGASVCVNCHSGGTDFFLSPFPLQ